MLHFFIPFLLLATAVNPGDVELKRLDGSTLSGQLTSWEGVLLTITTTDGPQVEKSLDILQLASVAAPEHVDVSPAAIELVDETRFPITKFTVTNRMAAVVSSLSSKPAPIPTDVIRRVEFRPTSKALEEAWRRIGEREAAGDALIIVKGDGEAFDYLTGVVSAVTDEQVLFQWDGQEVPIKRSKVAGIEFYHSKPRKIRTPYCVVKTTDGMTFPSREVILAGDVLSVTTPLGHQFDVGLNVFASADFSTGKMTYLSDLSPVDSKWTPRVALPKAATLVGDFGAPRTNTSFSGSALTLAWPNESLATGRELRTFAKGLALRSRTTLDYVLPAGMKHFVATAGIDPATTEQGHVVLEIRADGRVVWEGEIDGKQPPVAIDVELKSARRLQILVDYGRNLDYGDRLNLVEARVIK